ncbi:MAG TPA: Hsp20/alpha crystallin family protein [Abditibacteriaceae bacterium]|jgi:HSP20 family protein
MSIAKWSPFQELAAFHDDMNRLFSRLDGGEVEGRQSWMLPLDVYESKDRLRIKAALPGLDPKDINIQVDDNVLTISGQRRMEDKGERGEYRWIETQYGSFSRSVTLPPYVDTMNIEAHFHNGMLELSVPRREEAKPRRIELKTGTEPAAITAGTSEGAEETAPQTSS